MNAALLSNQPSHEGEPVFDAPWQARTFAMAVKLHETGLFSWPEWAERLSENIAQAEAETDDGDAVSTSEDYYTLWQQTLESLVAEKTAKQS